MQVGKLWVKLGVHIQSRHGPAGVCSRALERLDIGNVKRLDGKSNTYYLIMLIPELLSCKLAKPILLGARARLVVACDARDNERHDRLMAVEFAIECDLWFDDLILVF